MFLMDVNRGRPESRVFGLRGHRLDANWINSTGYVPCGSLRFRLEITWND